MKIEKFSIYLFMLMFFCVSISAEELETQRIRKSPFRNEVNWLITQASKNRITIIGLITPQTLKQFKESVEELPQIKEIVVDSQGGENESAIGIAKIIKSKNMNITVDGRCLSACAFFLFPAAIKKTVLKNSIVAIHEITYHLMVDGSSQKSVSGNEIDVERKVSKNPDEINYLNRIKSIELDFYQNIGVRFVYYASYVKYVSNRKRYLGIEEINLIDGNESCPRFLGWVLNKQQLENSGIRGIESFWFPENEQDKKNTFQINQLEKEAFFQGEESKLLSYCREKPVSWFTRQFNAIKILKNKFFRGVR